MIEKLEDQIKSDLAEAEKRVRDRFGVSPVRQIDFADKESLVELMFSVQTGRTSCRRAASDIHANFQEIERENARLREELEDEKERAIILRGMLEAPLSNTKLDDSQSSS